MKNMLLLSMFVQFFFCLYAQNVLKDGVKPAYDEMLSISDIGYEPTFTRTLQPDWNSVPDKLSSRNSGQTRGIVSSFVLDYDLVERVYIQSNGYDYERDSYDINEDFPDSLRRTLDWAGVIFDTIIQVDPLTDDLISYPLAASTITIDTVVAHFVHQNDSGDINIIKLSVFEILPPNNTFSLVYSDSLVVDTSISQPGSQPNTITIETFTIAPGITLSKGNGFYVQLDFKNAHPLRDDFRLINGFRDECFGGVGSCHSSVVGEVRYGEPAIVEDNAYYFLNWTQDEQVFSAINLRIGRDCDGDGDLFTPGECEWRNPQNLWIDSKITLDVEFGVTPSADKTLVCPGDQVTLDASVFGNDGFVSYFWTTQSGGVTGIEDPNKARTAVTVSETTTFTLMVLDAANDTATSSITIEAHLLDINAGQDQTISCGQETNLVAQLTSSLDSTVLEWNNRDNEGNIITKLENDNLVAGVYAITATNTAGCTVTDAVSITYPGVSQTVDFSTSNLAIVGTAHDFINNSRRRGDGWVFTWDFGDGSTTTVESPSYTYSSPGNRLVSLRADSSTCAFARAYREIDVRNPSGIVSGSTSSEIIKVFPNPTQGVFTVDFGNTNNPEGTLSIVDVNAKEIYREIITLEGLAQMKIDVQAITTGIYFLKIQLDDKVVVKKLSLYK